jgi:hypothetical protein
MNLNRLLRTRQLLEGREGRPFNTFYKLWAAHFEAEEELSKSSVSAFTKWLFQRAFVISSVTATEVYFREMLDTIFRTCKPETFESKLKELHKTKYDIDELVVIYQKRVHPCELVVEGLSFQRIGTIEDVFSKLLEKPFWKSVVPIQLRQKDEPEKILHVTEESVKKFEKLLHLRHELIHHPDPKKTELSEDELDCLYEIPFLILACNIQITSHIAKNLDPELKKTVPKKN